MISAPEENEHLAAGEAQHVPEQQVPEQAAAEQPRELRAGDVMSTHLLTVDVSDGLLLTWELVRGADIHHIPVIDRGRCVGLLAERDLAVEVARNPLGQGRRIIRELLDDLPAYVRPETPLRTVARTLLQTGKDAVLVHGSDGQLSGLITSRDLLRALAGRVTPGPAGQEWDSSPALFRLMPVLPETTRSRR